MIDEVAPLRRLFGLSGGFAVIRVVVQCAAVVNEAVDSVILLHLPARFVAMAPECVAVALSFCGATVCLCALVLQRPLRPKQLLGT